MVSTQRERSWECEYGGEGRVGWRALGSDRCGGFPWEKRIGAGREASVWGLRLAGNLRLRGESREQSGDRAGAGCGGAGENPGGGEMSLAMKRPGECTCRQGRRGSTGNTKKLGEGAGGRSSPLAGKGTWQAGSMRKCRVSSILVWNRDSVSIVIV